MKPKMNILSILKSSRFFVVYAVFNVVFDTVKTNLFNGMVVCIASIVVTILLYGITYKLSPKTYKFTQ